MYHANEIYEKLQAYSYEQKELEAIEERYGLQELEAILEASNEWALKPTDPQWKEWDIDSKYTPDRQHLPGGERIQFCKHCGEEIIVPFPRRIPAGDSIIDNTTNVA
jgi:hypothetical protein